MIQIGHKFLITHPGYKKRQILIVFYYVIANVLSNKKPQQIEIELFIKDIQLTISRVFITQSYFAVPIKY